METGSYRASRGSKHSQPQPRGDTADCESIGSDFTAGVDLDAEDPLEGPAAQGKLRRRLLTFKEDALEDEFMRRWDDQNLGPATRLLCICIVLSLMFLVLFRIGLQNPLKNHLLCSNIFCAVLCIISLLILRMRWCSCETTTLAATVVLSCSIFFQSVHVMGAIFQVPGDYTMTFLYGAPQIILALVLLNNAVQSMRVRSSRCWILPVVQFVMLTTMYFATAPWGWRNTLFVSALFANASYFPWRGRWKEECRARTDWIENRELRARIVDERAATRMQLERVREIEERVRAMDALAGRATASVPKEKEPVAATATATGAPPEPAPQREDLSVPWPSRCGDPAFGRVAVAPAAGAQATLADADLTPIEILAGAPNELLRRSMSGRKADAARIRQMARRLTASDYDIKSFFDDSMAAFPELELFFLSPPQDGPTTASSAATRAAERATSELEYQRTICALFSVYWLVRLDSDGKRGFCLGISGDWKSRDIEVLPGLAANSNPRLSTRSVVARSSVRSVASTQKTPDPAPSVQKTPEAAKRQAFLQSADWAKMKEMVASSVGGGDRPIDLGRVEALLCLTAFHDILKMQWLCPQVVEAHAPYKGYAAGAVIQDHDIALAYVMEYYPDLLPSFKVLPPRMQKLLLFTQSKMQFNHGWFVQAEAPPGLMLSSLKGCLAAAQPGDLAFYFFHWLTDLSGAEGTPKGGAEKLVLKFPEPVLASFLRSIPFLEHLAAKTETRVTEQYLAARWHADFPNTMLPTGPSSVALLRLTVMAQGEAGSVAEAFHRIPSYSREVLSEELALTGCQDQCFEGSPVRGGPALLIYYGPALLQRCRGVQEMTIGLRILSSVFAAGRALWPRSLEEQGSTVLINVGQLRTHDVAGIMGSQPPNQRSLWLLMPKNHREASLELLPAGDANRLNRSSAKYWVLDLRENDTEGLTQRI